MNRGVEKYKVTEFEAMSYSDCQKAKILVTAKDIYAKSNY